MYCLDCKKTPGQTYDILPLYSTCLVCEADTLEQFPRKAIYRGLCPTVDRGYVHQFDLINPLRCPVCQSRVTGVQRLCNSGGSGNVLKFPAEVGLKEAA